MLARAEKPGAERGGSGRVPPGSQAGTDGGIRFPTTPVDEPSRTPYVRPVKTATFGPATLEFLAMLSINNEKAWFDAHRADYEAHYLAPALAFMDAVRAPLTDIEPDIQAEARVNGSLFRINRDIRFSRDKTPYKDHVDLFFWIGEGRSRERPGFFFRLGGRELVLGAGMHGFDPVKLAAFRAAVLDERRGSELMEAAEIAEHAGATLGGVGYKRLPAPFDPAHLRARFLHHNALHAGWTTAIPAEFGTDAFPDLCVQRFRPLAGLARWVAAL